MVKKGDKLYLLGVMPLKRETAAVQECLIGVIARKKIKQGMRSGGTRRELVICMGRSVKTCMRIKTIKILI